MSTPLTCHSEEHDVEQIFYKQLKIFLKLTALPPVVRVKLSKKTINSEYFKHNNKEKNIYFAFVLPLDNKLGFEFTSKVNVWTFKPVVGIRMCEFRGNLANISYKKFLNKDLNFFPTTIVDIEKLHNGLLRKYSGANKVN